MHCTKFHNSIINKEHQESDDTINEGNKLFLCFRPVVMYGSGSVSGVRGNSNSFDKYIEMDNKDGVAFPHSYSALPKEKDVNGHRRKKSKRKFLRAIKAVLFETSLARKIRRKAFSKKTKHSTGDLQSNNEKSLNPEYENSSLQKFSRKNDGTCVTFAPLTNSSDWSSRNSSMNSTNSMLLSDRKLPFESYNNSMESKKNQDMEQEDNGRGYYSSTAGLVLLLVTLLVLVFWGKLYAILCTSTWLFFVPNWNYGKKLLKIKVNSESMDLDECKKKIVMEETVLHRPS